MLVTIQVGSMESEQVAQPDINVTVRNIGGIEETDVTIPPGVTVLSGRNATNRTSFLHAIMAGLGSSNVSLKGDANEGSVSLSVGDETYTRSLEQSGRAVHFSGNPYLDDPEIADLFAFLLEDNEARRAVSRGDDLRELIMRPVDTEQIESEISQLEAEKRDCDATIDRLEREERKLPDLEARRRDLVETLEDKREALAAVLEEIDALDADIEESRSRKEDLEAAFADLRDARSTLEDYEFELETARETRSDLQSERTELQDRLDRLEGGEQSVDERKIAGQIEELRERKRAHEDRISQLQSIVRFNEEQLEGDSFGLAFDDQEEQPISEKLLPDAETTCWTCGSNVAEERIHEMVDRLRSLRQELMAERNEIRERIDELASERKEVVERREARKETEQRIEAIEQEIDRSTERIEALEEQIAEQRETISDLADRTEELGTGDYDRIVEKHREANELELEIERIEAEIEEVEEQIESCEAAAEEREAVERRREQIASQLTELRTAVDRLEEEAVESFNEHIAAVLDILEYENIERIWIERTEQSVREGRRTVSQNQFTLNIIRSTEDGTTYQDTVDHLSESERKVTGLVFALAGYLVHDVHETIPFMVLDSLEAIDSGRLAKLVDYFDEFVDYLVVALLPEDAEALSDDYNYISNI